MGASYDYTVLIFFNVENNSESGKLLKSENWDFVSSKLALFIPFLYI